MEIKDVIELMRAVSENGLTELELEHDKWKLVMKREKETVEVMKYVPEEIRREGTENLLMLSGNMTAAQNRAEGREKEISGNMVKCPLVGTFYSASSPEAESFVKVGDYVKKGQILGIVEAMKLMNEIESEFDGVVGQVFVNNGETVEYGQPLFEIR